MNEPSPFQTSKGFQLLALATLVATFLLVVVGGIVPPRDVEPLRALGVHRVFPMGTPLPAIVDAFKEPR